MEHFQKRTFVWPNRILEDFSIFIRPSSLCCRVATVKTVQTSALDVHNPDTDLEEKDYQRYELKTKYQYPYNKAPIYKVLAGSIFGFLEQSRCYVSLFCWFES